MIELEGLLCPRVRKPATSEVVEFRDETSELASLNTNWAQLVLVVLGEGTESKTKPDWPERRQSFDLKLTLRKKFDLHYEAESLVNHFVLGGYEQYRP